MKLDTSTFRLEGWEYECEIQCPNGHRVDLDPQPAGAPPDWAECGQCGVRILATVMFDVLPPRDDFQPPPPRPPGRVGAMITVADIEALEPKFLLDAFPTYRLRGPFPVVKNGDVLEVRIETSEPQ